MRIRGRRCALACAAIAGLLAPAAPVEPHAMLVRSVPASRATVRQPPTRVELWFTERLEPAFSTGSVWNAAAGRVDAGDANVSSSDPKRLSMTLSRMEPGRYTVRYRVVSVDSHVVEGSFTFSVTGDRGAR